MQIEFICMLLILIIELIDILLTFACILLADLCNSYCRVDFAQQELIPQCTKTFPRKPSLL
jgi:hypothetical protein